LSCATDSYSLARRRQPMSLAAEMQWQLLPPLTFVTSRVVIAGLLEPAYEVAGDAFDYALNGDIAHLAVIDPVGHDRPSPPSSAASASSPANWPNFTVGPDGSNGSTPAIPCRC
jgi:hypothetical protein